MQIRNFGQYKRIENHNNQRARCKDTEPVIHSYRTVIAGSFYFKEKPTYAKEQYHAIYDRRFYPA